MDPHRASSLAICGLLSIAAVTSLSACSGLLPQPGSTATPAQPAAKPKAVQHAKAAPKPEPTQADLYAYVRGKLLSLSPSDGINDNQDVAFDPATSVLSI